MSDSLLEKVIDATDLRRYVSAEIAERNAKAAIAVVLAEMMEPSEEMEEAADEPFSAEWKRQREYSQKHYGKDAFASGGFSSVMWKAMLRAFAAEHSIKLE